MRILSEKINWRIALGELVLIVAGILIALAVDSYADRRADRAVSAGYLSDLVLELQEDSANLQTGQETLGKMIASATQLLMILEGEEDEVDDTGRLLVGALFGEGITPDSVVWEELVATGSLRLIENPETRTAIVSYFLDRSTRFTIIDDNFTPAVRALRAMAWDVLPVSSFANFFENSGTGVANEVFLLRLRARDDAKFLLKRLINTATVARMNLKSVASSTDQLVEQLAVYR